MNAKVKTTYLLDIPIDDIFTEIPLLCVIKYSGRETLAYSISHLCILLILCSGPLVFARFMDIGVPWLAERYPVARSNDTSLNNLSLQSSKHSTSGYSSPSKWLSVKSIAVRGMKKRLMFYDTTNYRKFEMNFRWRMGFSKWTSTYAPTGWMTLMSSNWVSMAFRKYSLLPKPPTRRIADTDRSSDTSSNLSICSTISWNIIRITASNTSLSSFEVTVKIPFLMPWVLSSLILAGTVRQSINIWQQKSVNMWGFKTEDCHLSKQVVSLSTVYVFSVLSLVPKSGLI